MGEISSSTLQPKLNENWWVWVGDTVLPSFRYGVVSISRKLLAWNEWGKKEWCSTQQFVPFGKFLRLPQLFPLLPVSDQDVNLIFVQYSYGIPQNEYNFLKWRVQI